MPPNQDQDQDQTPDQTEANPTSQPSSSSTVGGMKIIQPTGNVTGPENPTPLATAVGQPISAVAPPVPTVSPPPSSQSVNAQSQTTGGLSRTEIEAEAAKENKRRLLKKMLIVVPVGLVLIGVLITGLLFAKNTFLSNLNTKTLTNGGYTYTFKFYKQAQPITIEGVQGSIWKINSDSLTSATPKPTNDALVSSCNGTQGLTTNAQGLTEGEAFTASIAGTSQPVCMEENSTIQIFEAHFNAANHNHFLLLIFSKDSQSASKYPAIKKIFNSVQVTKT